MKHWKLLLGVAVVALVAALIGCGWWAWTHWATFTLIAWYVVVSLTIATALVSTFLFLHPLDFVLRGRLTPRGQRGEVLFSYFFGWFGLGATASPATQKVWVRLGSREWQLWKNVRASRTSGPRGPGGPANERASVPPAAEMPSAETVRAAEPGPSASRSPSETGAFDSSPASEEVLVDKKPVQKRDSPVQSEASVSGDGEKEANDRSRPPDEKTSSPFPERSMSVAQMLAQKRADDRDTTAKPVSGSPSAAATTDSTPGFEEVTAPPVVMVDEPGDSGSDGPRFPAGGGASGSGGENDGGEPGRDGTRNWLDSLLTKLKRWRRTLAQARRKVREGWQISRRLWRRFSPILWRLVGNLWATVSLLGPRIWVRHGLDAPEITGMLHGLAATFGGIARVFGARFEAVPVFCTQTIYVKGDVGISVSSYRSLYCLLRFLFEKELWKGGLDLYRWHRARKASKKADGDG